MNEAVEKIDEQQWTTVITSEKKKFSLGIKELFQYKDLVFLLFRRDFVATYKQTILGPAWYLIQPLFTIVIYSFVFGNLAGLGTEGVPQPLFYLSGVILWQLFSSNINIVSNTFLDNAHLFGKVYFPRLASPIAVIMSSVMKTGIQFFMLSFLYLFFIFKGVELQVHWSLSLFPFLLLHICLLSMGLGLVITSVTTKYRDLRYLVSFGLQLWMYGTPIAYSLSEIKTKLGASFEWLFRINPVTFPVEVLRFMLFQKNEIDWIAGCFSLGITLIVFIWGSNNFNKVQRSFMDRI